MIAPDFIEGLTLTGTVELIGLDKPVARKSLARWAQIIDAMVEAGAGTVGEKLPEPVRAKDIGIARMPQQLLDLGLVERYENVFGDSGFILGVGAANLVCDEWLEALA